MESAGIGEGSNDVDRTYDLVVIGGGAAGLAAASEGVRRGKRVALVEADRLGGDCTWTGCVPSKTLIAAAARGDGFAAGMRAVRDAVMRIAGREDAATLREQGIEVFGERAVLEGGGVVSLGGAAFRAGAVVIATGARPVVPEIEGLDDVGFLTTETVFEQEEAPDSLTVLGGGPVACELAQAFARLGVRVTVVEATARLLPGEEAKASGVVDAALQGDGVTVVTGHAATKAELVDGGVRLQLDDGSIRESSTLLVAVGRRPTTQGLGLAHAGIALNDHGHITVDTRLRTSARGVYAAGDVTGLMPFTHAAHEMGRLAAANALSRGRGKTFSTDAIPSVVFTDPEVARVGVLEAEAPTGARVAEVDMDMIDRAVASGDERGFVKLIAAPRPLLRNLGGGKIVGATVVGPRAGELIHELTLALRTKMFSGRLVQTVHAYPTWSIAIRKAAAQLFLEVDGREARPVGQPAQSDRRSST